MFGKWYIHIFIKFSGHHHERNLKELEDKDFEVKRRLKEAYKDFAHKKKLERSLFRFCRKKEARKKVIKLLLKRSLKEGNKDKKEGNEENKRSF